MPAKGSTKQTLAFSAAASVAAARLSMVPPMQSRSNEPNSVLWGCCAAVECVVAVECGADVGCDATVGFAPSSVSTVRDLGENGAVVDAVSAALLGLTNECGLFALLWLFGLLGSTAASPAERPPPDLLGLRPSRTPLRMAWGSVGRRK
mmetsp:Transcript_98676/g.307423  ORF Transcript_98676/g.307423 Transcript_98676/m.307423 type:complete len:149 (-) Transcript_98676:97-543(-)